MRHLERYGGLVVPVRSGGESRSMALRRQKHLKPHHFTKPYPAARRAVANPSGISSACTTGCRPDSGGRIRQPRHSQGEVRSWFELEEASRGAWSVPGVTHVDNQLVIHY